MAKMDVEWMAKNRPDIKIKQVDFTDPAKVSQVAGDFLTANPDVKGLFAVWWLPSAVLPGVGVDPQLPRDWLTAACGFAVIVGHVYPVWFSFRGGKGAATVVGVIAAVDPWLILPMVVSWFIVLVLTGYVGLATMLSGVALVIVVGIVEPHNSALLSFCALVAGFIIYTHRGNIARMRAGQEHRVRRLWLFRSRIA
jgi:glycerol-3-phosphate acyltransferase PlsY